MYTPPHEPKGVKPGWLTETFFFLIGIDAFCRCVRPCSLVLWYYVCLGVSQPGMCITPLPPLLPQLDVHTCSMTNIDLMPALDGDFPGPFS